MPPAITRLVTPPQAAPDLVWPPGLAPGTVPELTKPRRRLRVATWNILECGMRPEHASRVLDAATVIRAAAPDIVMLQEIGSVETLAQLAAATGMDYRVEMPGHPDGAPTYDPGTVHYGVALLWNPDTVTAIGGTLRTYTEEAFFHGAVALLFDVGEGEIWQGIASHLTPMGSPLHEAEAKRLVIVATRSTPSWPAPYAGQVFPAILATDSNNITGDLCEGPDGRWTYHVTDPYTALAWFPDLLFRCLVIRDPDTGERLGHRADRTAGTTLFDAGLYESAAVLGVPPIITTGHWTSGHVDPFSHRGVGLPVDHIRVTADLRDRIQAAGAISGALVEATSDHKPCLAILTT